MDAAPDTSGRSKGVPRSLASRVFLVLRVIAVLAVVVLLLRPLVPRVVSAANQLQMMDPRLIVAGFGLQVLSLFCYSLMTRVALDGERDVVSVERLFRIQLASRVVASTVPGGMAAGPAVGYRLMRTAGVSAHGASSSLASASVTSALVLNLLLWAALLFSIPSYGFNAVYATAAVVGVVLMTAVGLVVFAIVDGSQLLERPVAWVANKVRVDEERVISAIRGFGDQISALISNRELMARIAMWAAANWLLDALSLWVFLRAFGVSMHPVGVLVAFGVANVLAAIPVTPGGLGIVEWAYIPILVTFGASLEQATIAVAAYRIAQFLFPILLGSLASVSLALESRFVRRRATA